MRTTAIFFLTTLVLGCGAAPPRPTAPRAVALPSLPEGAPRAALQWAELTPATFARAKAERRFIVMDGSAEWCHWCHVMEATTYHDPKVAELLRDHFIQVKVDVDARPDIEERYGDYGWPATVLFSPDAEELGKYRGYIPPEDFLEILKEVIARASDATPRPDANAAAASPLPDTPLAEETLAWIEHAADVELEEYWDPKEGGWGRMPKVPLGDDNTWALFRSKGGDAVLGEHLAVVLEKERSIMDPVWGGIYQYSVANDWVHPHYEKLMVFNAGALENYASAYALTKNPAHLNAARSIQRYLEGFLRSAEGAFHGTQDADLNAHEPGSPFLSGEKYYALDDAHRRALGVPRVDPHEYASDNGLAIAAYVSLFEATRDEAALDTAKRAASMVLSSHGTARGGLTHDADGSSTTRPASKNLHLADNATFGWGLMRIFDVNRDPKILEAAAAIGDFMLKELADPRGGGFFATTEDPDAVGIFKIRRKPFDENTIALRFLAKLAKGTAKQGERILFGLILRQSGLQELEEVVVAPDGELALGLDALLVSALVLRKVHHNLA